MSKLSAKAPLNLLSGPLLARNVVWNLIGTAIPLVVAIPALPVLIRTLGADRFGVLTICWVMVGYFSIFDLGLGRALTKILAEKIGRGEGATDALIWTALLMMLLLGCIGGAVLAGFVPWVVDSVLHVPAAIRAETMQAFWVLTAALPIVVSSTGLRGILEAYQRFQAVSSLRAVLGVLTFGSPLAVLPFSMSLVTAAWALGMSRVLLWLVNFVLCWMYLPDLRRTFRLEWAACAALLRFGCWMTISNLVNPILAYIDRFVIAAMISVTVVAYYATPYEFVTKLLLIPGAMVAVLFPAFSASFADDRDSTTRLFESAAKFAFLGLFPFALVTVAFASEGLSIWIGRDFAEKSTPVLQWLAAGVFMNGLAQLPFSQLQATGQPDLTAKLNLAELPVYLLLLWFLVRHFGIAGAAMAWTLRVTLDSALLFAFSGRSLPGSATIIRNILLSCAGALLLLAISAIPMLLPLKVAFISLVFFTLGLTAWKLVLTREETSLIFRPAQTAPSPQRGTQL